MLFDLTRYRRWSEGSSLTPEQGFSHYLKRELVETTDIAHISPRYHDLVFLY